MSVKWKTRDEASDIVKPQWVNFTRPFYNIPRPQQPSIEYWIQRNLPGCEVRVIQGY